MVANIFSEEYIFFSDFLNHIFLLGIVFKKRRANLSDVAKERVKSPLIDIHGSSICFGGTHEVFTRGYARAGITSNHLQVHLTQIATAFIRAPYTFVRSGKNCMKANSVLPSTDCVVHDPLEHECVAEVVPPQTALDWAKPCAVPVLGNRGDDGPHVFSPDNEVEPVSCLLAPCVAGRQLFALSCGVSSPPAHRAALKEQWRDYIWLGYDPSTTLFK
jgi:hypothetical protein